MIEKLDLNGVPKNLKKHPIFKGMSSSLKTPEKYKEIESKVRLIMVSDHKHSKVSDLVNCTRCSDKIKKKQQALKDFGFVSYSQYLQWRKIMDIIVNKKSFELK